MFEETDRRLQPPGAPGPADKRPVLGQRPGERRRLIRAFHRLHALLSPSLDIRGIVAAHFGLRPGRSRQEPPTRPRRARRMAHSRC